MICPRCGTMNQNGIRFCVSCGSPLTQGQPGGQYGAGGQGRYGAGPMQANRGGFQGIAGIDFRNPLVWGFLGSCFFVLVSIFLPLVSAYGYSASMVGLSSQFGGSMVWVMPLLAAIVAVVFFFLQKPMLHLICAVSCFTWIFRTFISVIDAGGSGLAIGFYLWILAGCGVLGTSIALFFKNR